MWTRVIRMAAKDGIVVMLDPLETAGLLQTALANGSTRCRAYGRYLGNRYKDFPNIIWLNGKDFQTWRVPANDAVMTAVALGIKDEDPNTPSDHGIELSGELFVGRPELGAHRRPESGLHLLCRPTPKCFMCYNQSAKIPVFMGEANFEYERNTDEDGGSPHVLRMQEYWTHALRGDRPALRQ